MNEPTPVIKFEMDWKGETHSGCYWTHDGLITVKSSCGRESCTHLGGTPGPALAHILLREMVE